MLPGAMIPTEFHQALGSLGIAQQRVAHLFDVSPRAVRRWRDGERRVPRGVEIVVRLMADGVVTLEAVERAANPIPARMNGGARVCHDDKESSLPPTASFHLEPLLEAATDLAAPVLEPSAPFPVTAALPAVTEPLAIEVPAEEPQPAQRAAHECESECLVPRAVDFAEPVEARREKAKELVDAGLSVRETAKALGVSKSTVHRDVFQNGTDAVAKSDRQSKAERCGERELALAAKQEARPSQCHGVTSDPGAIFAEAAAEPSKNDEPPAESATTDKSEFRLNRNSSPEGDEPQSESPPATTAEKLAALTSRVCHFPLGDPRDSAFRFCGDPTIAPPYCDAHRGQAYLPVPARNRQVRAWARAGLRGGF
jgi:GcrA cell cycle regulator